MLARLPQKADDKPPKTTAMIPIGDVKSTLTPPALKNQTRRLTPNTWPKVPNKYIDRACFLLIRDSFFFQLITSAIYFKPILTCISFELLNQSFIPLAFSEKEGNGLSISEFDIESIATPTTGATTEQ